jgi:UDP-glucose 4-epimerase
MTCSIFGGGGFIGSAVSDLMISKGRSIRIVEHPRAIPYRKFSDGESVEWIAGDMFDTSVLDQALDGAETLIHLVSTTLPRNSDADPIHDVESNLIGTLRLLEVAVRKGVRKILFISSGGTVYGRPDYLPIDETHPTNPIVAYGVTKLAIEKFLLLYAHKHGLDVRILRVSNPYGPRQRIETAQGAVTMFMHRVLSGQSIEIWGDGSVIRDYLHVADVADAFLKALEYDGASQIFNISSGVGVSLNELATRIMMAAGKKADIVYHPSRNFDVHANVLCNGLAGRELGWQPAIGMEEGLGQIAGIIG